MKRSTGKSSSSEDGLREIAGTLTAGIRPPACAPAGAMQASNRRRRLLASRSAGHLGLQSATLPHLGFAGLHSLSFQQGFARLRAGRVAALTCHRHVIHYRSLRIPASVISKIFPLPLAGGIFLVLQQGFEPWTPALKGRCSTC